MTVRAVIFDIGGVLEVVPEMDALQRWERTLALAPGSVTTGLRDVWRAGSIGTMTEPEVHEAVQERLGVPMDRVDAMMADMWVQYLGVGNTELIEYARPLRPRYRTGILSNSFVGARAREQAAYGFEDLVDEIVYSHEIGFGKPDPRTYALACERLAVHPGEAVFVDDIEPMVAAARVAGLHAIHHRDNTSTIRALGALLAA